MNSDRLDVETKKIIDNFTKEVENADPKIKKRAVQALLHKISIFHQKGSPWERFLEINGLASS